MDVRNDSEVAAGASGSFGWEAATKLTAGLGGKQTLVVTHFLPVTLSPILTKGYLAARDGDGVSRNRRKG